MNYLYDLLTKFQDFVLSNIWFAPLSAVLLPFLEALLPSLPLTILVSFNLTIMASTYGVLSGTLLTIVLSTLGSLLGMVLIFFLIRATFGSYFAKKVESHPYGKKFLNIVEGPNTFLVLVLLSNPFLPSSILNYTLSLTKIKVGKYLWLTATSRLIIILFLVFLGSVFDIQSHPFNALWVLITYFGLLGLWVLWRKIDQNNKKKETHENL
ncbi:MAG: TVP38/TMEM64 family protein [Candidatus Izemoplasmatales bacterium]